MPINPCWKTLKIGEIEKEILSPKIILWKIQVEFACPIHAEKVYIGIDPGTKHLGIAVLDAPNCKNEVCYATLYQITAQREALASSRMKQLHFILDELRFPAIEKVVTVEGADYRAVYRQVELAEIRGAAMAWFKPEDKGEIIPIKSIRKMVLGSGNLLPHEIWTSLKKYPDAAQGLACALYPLTKPVDSKCLARVSEK